VVGNPAPGNEAFDDNGGGNCMRPPNEFAESLQILFKSSQKERISRSLQFSLQFFVSITTKTWRL
jgi:hypothetical protein